MREVDLKVGERVYRIRYKAQSLIEMKSALGGSASIEKLREAYLAGDAEVALTLLYVMLRTKIGGLTQKMCIEMLDQVPGNSGQEQLAYVYQRFFHSMDMLEPEPEETATQPASTEGN